MGKTPQYYGISLHCQCYQLILVTLSDAQFYESCILSNKEPIHLQKPCLKMSTYIYINKEPTLRNKRQPSN